MPSPTLTRELALQVASVVSTGASYDDVAGALGVDRRTLYRWRQAGRALWEARGEADFLPPERIEEPYELLYTEMSKAKFEAKVEALGAVRRAFRGYDEKRTKQSRKLIDGVLTVVAEETTTVTKFDWQAAMTWLERAFPQEFTRLMRAELSGPGGGPIPIEERAKSLGDEIRVYQQGVADAEALAAEESAADV